MGACLLLWTEHAEGSAHFTPEYKPVKLDSCLQKETLTEEDYQLIFCQTGLGRRAVDMLRREAARDGQEKMMQEIRFLQERFFREVTICCEQNTIATRQELLEEMEDKGMEQNGEENPICFPAMEDGDILVTFNCHCFGWRSGHAGIVTNAEEGQVLEATMIGSNSGIMPLSHWEQYPSVAVLRLKDASRQEREKIAAYGEENLQDQPYRLSAGLFAAESGTQCAHLVWKAYLQFGYDLDGDGGRIVTPHDLYESPLLEVIQIYGMDPEACFHKF